ncbi:MAG: hypothetical protein M9933_04795 [Chitinophagaceae bacterium]|nr:hypothetical protein [Chitinophagaceae bacterium]
MNIPAIDWKGNDGVSITTDSLFVEEGKIYDFKNKKGCPQAFYSRLGRYLKLDSDSGRLSITKHDKLNRILSGTFFFIGTNTAGEKMNITEGRFDIVY